MRALLDFLAVFAGIYLFDCLHWARRGTIGFRAWWRRRMHVVPSEAMPGNERYGVVIAQPLPPFGRLFLTESFPLSITRDVAASFTYEAANPGLRPRQVQRAVPFDAPFEIATENRRVLVGGELLVEAGSARLAQRIRALVLELARLERGQREKRIDEWLRASLDTRAARERVVEYERVSPAVRLACTVQVAHVFVVTPLVGFWLGLALTWIPLCAALFVFQAGITWTFLRAHRALHPDARRARRVEAVLIALSPPSAMRAFDSLSRDLLAEFHPVAAAAVLLPPEEFRDLLERTLRDALHPLPVLREAPEEIVSSAAEAWRERTIAALEGLARREGVKDRPWREAPRRMDAECLGYCPRCVRQFTQVEKGCERCLDMPLKSFGPT
jgi:hypothetical protein